MKGVLLILHLFAVANLLFAVNDGYRKNFACFRAGMIAVNQNFEIEKAEK